MVIEYLCTSGLMSNKALKTAAIMGIILGASALSGCSSLGGLGFDRTQTASVGSGASINSSQSMPGSLQSTNVAYLPPADIGNSGGSGAMIGAAATPVRAQASVTSQDLPSLSSPSNGAAPMMPAAKPLVSLPQDSSVPVTQTLAAAAPAPVAAPAANLVAVPSDAYVHMVESGESLYTIARRYNVTAQAIIQANGFSAPDKIYVGQKLVIPGRADLLAKMGPKVAAAQPLAPAEGTLQAPAAKATQVASLDTKVDAALAAPKPLVAAPVVAAPKAAAPAQPLASAAPVQQPAAEPASSGADKFRWPVSGRVITDFANSKGTGINIEAPEGTAVRAAENGQVIYAGSGVEGYGNLILIRHPNGFVSAYAHLKDMSVAKGTVVNRGDVIGSAGKTGSVAKSQLHFELRKGATPVDPMPLLAS
jgi:murein DD-endopeptidase MepM/ murein hydrolase activator NlpD